LTDGSRVRIRPLEQRDRDFVLSLSGRLFAVGRPAWRDPERLRAFHRHYAELTAAAGADGEVALIAEGERGEALGVVHVTTQESGLTGERQAYLATLAVTEEAEGRGVASALLAAAEEWARAQGFRLLALDVFAENARARSFYARRGFQEETLTLIKELGRATVDAEG
jgi:GNAT superfamily N-acetyltransferase